MKYASRHFPRVNCIVCVIAITLFGAGACARAQTTSTAPAFEVATIKPAAPLDTTTFGPRISPTRASYGYMTLKELTAWAFEVKDFQISGPGWMASERFDIVARLPKGAAKEDEKRMLQDLLKTRFKLTIHVEKRKGEVYALVVGKHGVKLKPSLPDATAFDPNAPLKPGESYIREGDSKTKITTNKDGSSTVDNGKNGTFTTKFDWESKTLHFEYSKITMEEFANALTSAITADGHGGHIVIDQTGIKGDYQVAYNFPIGISLPNQSKDGGEASDPEGSISLTRSLDALGLKLEKRKAPIDVYVVDHVEKPSEN